MQTPPSTSSSISKQGKLFLVVGPSGSGKGTAIVQLKKRHPDYVFPVSCTTRAPRPGEKEGEVYSYISKEQFRAWIDEGRFLEWAEVHQDNCYGILKAPIEEALSAGKVVIREVDIQGYKTILATLPRESVVGIFILVSDLDELQKRIRQRAPVSEEEMTRRLESARMEISQMHLCNYQVESPFGHIEQTVMQIEEIIAKEIAE